MPSAKEYDDLIGESWDPDTDAGRRARDRLIDEAIKAFPTSAVFRRMRAQVEMMTPGGDIVAAKRHLDEALAIAPDDADTLCELGYWHDVYGDAMTARAFRYFRRSVRRGGGPDAWYGLIRCALQRGRESASARFVRRMESLYPDERSTVDARQELDDGTWRR